MADEFRLRCRTIVPRTSTGLFSMDEMWQLGSVLDSFAAPAAGRPSRHALLPVLVPVVDDPALELSRATRALAGAEDLLGADADMSVWALDADDVRAVVADMRAMRTRHVREIERGEEDMRVDAAVVLKTMSELRDTTPTPPPPVERPPAAKRRRVDLAEPDPEPEPTCQTTMSITLSGNEAASTSGAPGRTRRRQLSPGQKRANHIVSEQMRRARIRAGCDALSGVVPALKALAQDSFSKPEEFVVAETVKHVRRMQLNQAALLRRLDDVRLARPDVSPLTRPDPAPWERTWDGGTERLEDDAPHEGHPEDD